MLYLHKQFLAIIVWLRESWRWSRRHVLFSKLLFLYCNNSVARLIERQRSHMGNYVSAQRTAVIFATLITPRIRYRESCISRGIASTPRKTLPSSSHPGSPDIQATSIFKKAALRSSRRSPKESKACPLVDPLGTTAALGTITSNDDAT